MDNAVLACREGGVVILLAECEEGSGSAVLEETCRRLGSVDAIEKEIKSVVAASGDKTVKVIIETCYLTDEEKEACCIAAKKAEADFVKTSTGFGTGGATKEDIALMRKTVGPEMGVKASGGVRSLEDLEVMVEAGATRIGASAGIAIMQALKEKGEN